ncbi:hypothetical protein [Arcanobacterium phocae]|uniref:hypothetical protein n=1 Tax=Arcanobacterium phocae TaxID=131112 RepID=UPI001C0F11C6|nr:hypothetical protein [Arcanobacterium phocae]
MRIVETLGITEDVEFVDIDSERDVPLFAQPAMIRRDSRSGDSDARMAMESIQSFDRHCFALARMGDAHSLLRVEHDLQRFNEPKECGLGYAKESNSGKGSSEKLGTELSKSFNTYRMQVQVGLMDRLECLAALTWGIAKDRISDMVLKLARPALYEFTQRMCKKYLEIGSLPTKEIELEVWDVRNEDWTNVNYTLPVFHGNPVLLVPKRWTWKSLCFSRGSFYSVTILGEVQRRKTTVLDGKQVRPLKKQLRERYPKSEKIFTEEPQRAFDEYALNLYEQHLQYVDDEYIPNAIEKHGDGVWDIDR